MKYVNVAKAPSIFLKFKVGIQGPTIEALHHKPPPQKKKQPCYVHWVFNVTIIVHSSSL